VINCSTLLDLSPGGKGAKIACKSTFPSVLRSLLWLVKCLCHDVCFRCGVLVSVLRIFDWARWTMSILLLLVFPHNWEPYIHKGFSTELCSRTYYSRLRGDRSLISQWRLLAFSLRCILSALKCRRHVSFLSRCTPRYVTLFACGSRLLFNVSGRKLCLFGVNVTSLHFRSFTLIRQSDSYFSTSTRWRTSCTVVCIGRFKRLRIPVSSANVDVVSRVLVGRSAV